MESINNVTSGTLSLSKLFPDWSYLISAPFSSSQGITAVFLVALTFVFIGASGVFLYHLWRASGRISFISEKLEGIHSNELIQSREQIKTNMGDDKDCSALWDEFDESLVDSNDSDNRRLYNTIDASHFFDTHTLARGMTESRLMASIPGILTAIGVLGTFLGLTLGLGGLEEIGGGSTKHLEEGISGMIHAASVAFTTSFWGVLSSVVFNFFEKLFESTIRKKITELQNKIDSLFPRLTPEKMLLDISSHSKSSDETMLGLAEKIGNKMQEAVLQVEQGISAGIIQALHDVLEPAIGKLVDSANRQTQSSETAIENLVHSFMEKFGEAGVKQGKMMQDSAQDLQSLIEQMKQEQVQTLQRSEALDEQRQQALTSVVEEISEKFNQTGAEYSLMMQHSAQNLQSLIEQTKQEQIQALQRSEALDKQRQQALVGAVRKISELFNQFNLVSKQNTQVAENVVKQQQKVTESIQEVSTDLQIFAERIEVVTEQLGMSAKEIKEGNQALSNTSKVMANAVSNAAISNEQVSQSNQQTNQELQNLLNRIESSRVSAEEITAQLYASAEAGKDIFEELKHHQVGYRDALNNHVQELNRHLSEALERYANEVKEQTHERMNAWNQETLKYTTAMQGVVQGMNELVNEWDEHRNQ